MSAAEQARGELLLMTDAINRLLTDFREKTGLHIASICIRDVLGGDGRVVDQWAGLEARL